MSMEISYQVLRHFEFRGATVRVCTTWVIQCGLLSNKYVNQALKPKPLDSHVIQAV